MKKNSPFVRYIGIILTIILSSLFFITIYSVDNKYTQSSVQPIDGMLILTEDDLDNNPSNFLIRGWRFYPNVLLTPEQYNENASELYSTYVSIGENTGLTDENGVAPHGYGTYVLTLVLPEKTETYALYLPEIYCAYRLYIDDEEIISIGTPEKDNYNAVTANRMITFDHSGSNAVTVMLAVNNESYIYGGMVYPPSFGTPVALNYQRGINLGLYLAVISIVAFIMIFCLFFAIRHKHQNAVLYTLMCFFTILFIGYPILHTGFTLSVFPWYAIETTSGYIVLFLTILVNNRICRVRHITNVISSAVSAAFCILIFTYTMNASFVSGVFIDLFSNIIFCYKLLTAGYLLITGWHSTSEYNENYRPLFYASMFYASSCVWDRILPMYEPIYGGRFIEYGCLALVLSIGFMLLKEIIQSYSYSMAFAEEKKQMTRQLAMQTEYSAQIKQQYEEKRRLIHDFRQHIRVINSMVNSSDNNELKQYLSELSYEITSDKGAQSIVFCENTAVDALIRYYAGIMDEKGIRSQFHLTIPKKLDISDVELCTVLGNLIENAVEACENQNSGDKSVSVSSTVKGSHLFIVIRNTFNGEIRKFRNCFMSSKGINRPGIGISSSMKIISNNSGSINITNNDSQFQVGITLPLKSET